MPMAGDSGGQSAPSPQANWVAGLFVQMAKAANEFYWDSWQKVTRETRQHDANTLFETMAFFLFVTVIVAEHRQQCADAQNELHGACEDQVIRQFASEWPRDHVTTCLLERGEMYNKWLQAFPPGRRMLSSFFSGVWSILDDVMDVARSGRQWKGRDPLVIVLDDHILSKYDFIPARTVLYTHFAGLYEAILDALLADNPDFRSSPIAELNRRAARVGAERKAKYESEMHGDAPNAPDVPTDLTR